MSATQQLQLRQGDVIAKKYEVDSLLGMGPLGGSYAARTLANGKKVVLKLLAGPAASEAQAQELLARLRDVESDSLVRIQDTGELNGRRWVVTELVEGESLRRLMDEYAGQRKPFSLQEACQIIAKVLEAITTAHTAGVVHRHLKPQNVMVHSRTVGPGQGRVVRTVKVTGLGLSELVHPSVLQEGIAERPADARYMAPEITSPSAGGSAQSDVYSAGVMFYELLCGQTPMGTYLSPTRIREDLPAHVDDIVDIAIAANAEDRYPTARDMMHDIQRAFQDDDKPVGSLSRRTLAIVIGGTLGVMAVIAGIILLNDPVKEAIRADREIRAQVAKENPVPDAKVIQEKMIGHEDMVYIPAGTVILGKMHAEKVAPPTEALARPAKVGAFYIDRFEWENVKGGHPIVNLTWQQAQNLCDSKGKRLCTSEEWERACKGPDNQIYAYGDTFDPTACGPDVSPDTAPRDERADRASGELAKCVSGFGVYDMSGGTREWTGTTGSNDFRVLKGGKSGEAEKASRCGFSDERRPTLTDRSISVRCCLDDGKMATPAAPPAEGVAVPAPQ